VENRLAERDKRGRPVHHLDVLLANEQAAQSKASPGIFRSALGRIRRKVKMRPDGTW